MPSKVAHYRPKLFFQYCEMAQNQQKSQFLFHNNWSLRDLCIMILYLSQSSSSLLYWVNTEDTLPLVFWWVTGHSNPGLFNSKLQPRNSQPQTFQHRTMDEKSEVENCELEKFQTLRGSGVSLVEQDTTQNVFRLFKTLWCLIKLYFFFQLNLMQLFSADAIIFDKTLLPWKHKKTALKSCS